MFGFLLGGASLAGLLYMLRSHHHCGHYAYAGHGCGGGRDRCGGYGRGHGHCGGERSWGHHHGPPPWARGGFRARRRFILRRVFEELDTTPGQEKAIGRAVDRVVEAGRSFRSEIHDSLGDLPEALRADELDTAALDALFAQHDAALAAFRATASDALKEIHDALDEHQRARVADFIESRRRRWGGPYRTPPGDEE